MEQTRIDPRQLTALVFLSRVFVSLTFSPRATQSIEPTVSMVGSLGALGINLLVLVLLQRGLSLGPDRDLLDCAGRVHPLWEALCGWGMGAFCLLAALSTLCNFQYFMGTAVYPDQDVTLFLLLFGAAVCYGAWLGLEPLARFSVLAFVLTAVVTGVLLLGVSGELEPVFLRNPFQDGWKPLAQTCLTGVAVNQELAAYLLLVSQVREKGTGAAAKGLLWGNIYYELLIGAAALVLGSYGQTQTYPIYALTASAELVLIQRLDALHIAVWVFLAYVKTALFLHLGAGTLRRILPGSRREVLLPVLGLLVTVLSLWFVHRVELLGRLLRFANGGVPYLLAVLVLPGLTALLMRLRGRRAAA